ncbi:hypothetical protein QNI19_38560 [Cytophagaceae bacterium DM2B3-1]|uniref:Lipoprotein n=1 Tax=Xanthocytophaga flava TaxID=3048013 RepID=A0ABT7D290_9BACT|nr:hypothetical protein [Xanthocytophaga flavus]MDJ1473696.1 hypothetical protein [Xanthocytophaga flavus]MDJ1498894.1 hypothetical protein [Xanthocytophaga flavus]
MSLFKEIVAVDPVSQFLRIFFRNKILKYVKKLVCLNPLFILCLVSCQPTKLQGGYYNGNSKKSPYTNFVLKDNGEYFRQDIILVLHHYNITAVETGKYFMDGEKIRIIPLKVGYRPDSLKSLLKTDTSMDYLLRSGRKTLIYKSYSDKIILKKSRKHENVFLDYKRD